MRRTALFVSSWLCAVATAATLSAQTPNTPSPTRPGPSYDGKDVQVVRRGEQPAQRLGARIALVVGIDRYEHLPELGFAEKDAKDVEQALTAVDFTVTSMRRDTRLSPARAESILAEISALCTAADPQDTLLVFLSGHGFSEAGGAPFFCAQFTDPEHLAVTGLSLQEVKRRLEASKAGQKMLVVDACRNVPSRSAADRGLDLPDFRADSLAILFSTSPGSRSWEPRGREVDRSQRPIENGIFTHYLLRGLAGEADGVFAESRDGWLTFRELAYYVGKEVKAQTRLQQKPYLDWVGEAGGDILMRRIAPSELSGEHVGTGTSLLRADCLGVAAALRDAGFAEVHDINDEPSVNALSRMRALVQEQAKATDAKDALAVMLWGWEDRARDEVSELASRSAAGHVVVLVAGAEGEPGQGVVVAKRSSDRALGPIRAVLGVSLDGKAPPSQSEGGKTLFVSEVLRGMDGAADADGDGLLTFREIAYYVLREVRRKSNELVKPAMRLDGVADEDIVLRLMASSSRLRLSPQPVVPGKPEVAAGRDVSAWAKVLRVDPDPNVVTDAEARAKIVASGWPWRVEDKASGLVLLLVPPGEFTMGSPASEAGHSNDEKQHRRRITQAFYLGETEVTQSSWQRVMGNNPSHFRGPSNPVEQVGWDDIQPFFQKTGLSLPSEAQWEYSCRAGTTTAFSFGAKLSVQQANHNYGVKKTVPVGTLGRNAWGFADMHGNVREWCSDGYAAYPGDGAIEAPAAGLSRVLRGGSWGSNPVNCRAAYRSIGEPANPIGSIGFRAARAL